jgi:FkbM family methyltransferase
MIDLTNFDWGWMGNPLECEPGIFVFHHFDDGTKIHLSEYHKQCIISEIFEQKLYEHFFEVEENDLVVDVGSSLGPFTYSILHKKPRHVFCLEPSIKEFKTLNKNVRGYPVTTINKGISHIKSIIESDKLFGGENEMETITFKDFIENYSIDQIDFLKTDCEGGEYDIFNEENKTFILEKVKKIVGEWHLENSSNKKKFKIFRDNYLSIFDKFEVYSLDGIDIKWDLWNDHFIDYYTEVIINIDNR